MTSKPFVSPLAVFDPTALTTIDFGQVRQSKALQRLAAMLEGEIRGPILDLPASLRDEATGLLDAYPGPGRPFIGLFYVPIWSFLAHVVTDANRQPDADTLKAAQTAHALSLFLHLWDDHLTDNQMATDVLRLQLRSLAWQRFDTAVGHLAAQLPDGGERIAGLVSLYLTSIHRPPVVSGFDAYCARFNAQAGIWRVAPTAFGILTGGEQAATRLDQVICDFAAAWRVMDDLQDLDADVRSGQDNAVFHLLDADEKRVWTELRSSLGSASEKKAWSSFWTMIEDGHVATRTTDRIAVFLDRAHRMARESGWPSLAADLAAAARFTS